MDAELEFAIQPSTTGKQLFDQVIIFFMWCNLKYLFNFSESKMLVNRAKL